MNPEAWLAAARTGGLPEPTLRRWQPLRAGVVNLWEYDDAEFWYADGRLVLRGGNGAGKTKLLELTTLLLMRGEIVPSVLDPFGSQHRTMRYNLLPTGEEDDPRPMTDSGLGYAWTEYGRRDESGMSHYLICGLGASARRGSGTEAPHRWMFLTERRPGTDLVLAPAAGPLNEKELREVEGVRVYTTSAHYRSDLAAELFDLDPSGFDNLTELLKQLRRPKLGQRLNPRELERTLRGALPRLATDEVTQLAEGWDQLEELRRSVEQLEAAAAETARFTRDAWRRWARIVVRRRSDAFAAATTRLDNTTRERRQANDALNRAHGEVESTRQERERTRTRLGERRTELQELVDSSAYQDAVAATNRAEALEHTAAREAETAEAEKAAAEKFRERCSETAAQLESAQSAHAAVSAEAERTAGQLGEAADGAGVAVERFLRENDLAGLRSAHHARRARFDRLVELRDAWSQTRAETERTAQLLQEREQGVEEARKDHAAAEERVASRAVDLDEALVAWATALRAAPCTDNDIVSWRDTVADVASTGSSLLTARLREHLATARSQLYERQTSLTAQRDDLTQRLERVDSDLERIREAGEAPPPAPLLWARRERPEDSAAAGAPLWACVQPKDGIDGADLDRLEATLAAAGLLDAWLTPDGRLVTDPDTVLAPGSPVPHALTEILEPTPSGGVGAERIREALHGVGWYPSRPAQETQGVWLAADGSWRVGALTGRTAPARPASYLGATAREQARQRALRRLDAERRGLQDELEECERLLKEVEETQQRLDEESESAPWRLEEDLVRAGMWVESTDAQLKRAREHCDRAERAHRDASAEADSAWAACASYAAEHAFSPNDPEPHRQALDELRGAIDRYEGDLRSLDAHNDRLRQARRTHERTRNDAEDADLRRDEAKERARHARIAADTAYRNLGTEHQAQLDRRSELDREVQRLENQFEELSERLDSLRAEETRAQRTLDDYEQARQTAEQERDDALHAWWEAADCGLVAPLGVAVPQNRTVDPTQEAVRAVRRRIDVPTDAVDEDRAWRRCFESLQRLRQVLLPNRDGMVRDEDGNLPRVVILADQATGWVDPPDADRSLAAQVAARREQYDAEQKQALDRLLGSTFIEHLKERLDYTEWVFTRINDCLLKYPTRQGHTLRLAWRADRSDTEAGQVVEALRQGYEHLPSDRQDMIREFLRRRIDQAREDALADGLADWQHRLADALDYRSWLRIELQFKPGANARWRPFDAARHGSKSGGEKVVLLSQPLFAAAVVAYDAAGVHAPRQVWLDEAMTGVDTEVKASFMGLTVEFDLDVMLTAHDEWCRYATVPAVAVYDLVRQKHLPGVDALPHLWCGGEWTELERTLASRPTRGEPSWEGTLFE